MQNPAKTLLNPAISTKICSRLRVILNRVQYYGFKYKCPCCSANLKTFLPFGRHFPVLKEKHVIGGGYRQNVLCPICGSMDRERLLYLYLRYKTNIFKRPVKLLHVAPESNIQTILYKKFDINYLTADLNSESVMMKIDITNISYDDNSFDFIICNHVLEHIIDDRKAMAELYRILKPGGRAILQVPISASLESTYEDSSIITPLERERAFGQADHVRIYARDYEQRLEQVGFAVDIFEWSANNHCFGGQKNKFGLIEAERVYCARKPI
jgi:SAM-dependent methyltransferase